MDGNNFGDSNLNSGFGGGSYSGSQYNSPLGTDGQPTTPVVNAGMAMQGNPVLNGDATAQGNLASQDRPAFSQEQINQPVFDQPEFDQSVFGQPTTPPPVYEQQNYNQADYGYGQPTTPPPVGVPPYTDSQGNDYYMNQQYYEPVYDGKPAMILAFGIVSICCCAPFGIASIVMYLIGKDSFPEDKKGMATAGFICSIVGLSMRVLFFVLAFILGMLGAL